MLHLQTYSFQAATKIEHMVTDSQTMLKSYGAVSSSNAADPNSEVKSSVFGYCASCCFRCLDCIVSPTSMADNLGKPWSLILESPSWAMLFVVLLYIVFLIVFFPFWL